MPWLASTLTCVSRSAMSIWQPSPVSSRRRSAARIATVGIDAGEDVGIGDADLLRLAVRLAGQVHDAAHPLDHQVVAGAVRIGAVLAEAGDRAIDEPRIDLPQALVVEAVLLQPADLEVLDHDIGVRGEPPHQRPPLLRLEIGGDRPLAAIAGVEIGGRQRLAVAPFDEGRPPGARVVARARALDLHDIGAEIGQKLPGPGAGEDAGELEHAQAVERRSHGTVKSGLRALRKARQTSCRRQLRQMRCRQPRSRGYKPPASRICRRVTIEESVMEYVNLGTTGLKVSRICLGCMTYGAPARGTHPWVLDEEASRPFFKQALEAGINFFDTANVYSLGASEEITGRALKDFAKRDEVVIATKVFGKMRDDPNGKGLSRKAIMSEIDASLKRLGTDYVDLYQIHRWDDETPIEETLEALHDVVKAGKARYIGASSMWAWQFMKALSLQRANGWSRFVSMQNH